LLNRGNDTPDDDWTLAEAAAAVATKKASPAEILEACLRRAKNANAAQAFVELDANGARTRAATLGVELTARGPRSPLHGIPFAVKDVIDVQDMHTRANSRILRDNLAPRDAAVVARMRAAGANIIGKTATHEFAYGVVTPACRHPWDPGRIVGGSSGGSAVAVATGSALGALGTDTAGSIRIPASLCGVCGLRPRLGSVAMDGIIPTAPTLDVCGPMTRTAEDLALFWQVLAATATPITPRSNLRVGVPASLETATKADPQVCDAVREAVDTMRAAGATVSNVELPAFAEWDRWRSIPQMVEALAVHRDAGWYPSHASEYTKETLDSLRIAETLADGLELALQQVAALRAALLASIRDIEILVLPTTATVAPTHVAAQQVEPNMLRRPIVRQLTRLCGPISWADLAAASVPCGIVDDLPVGLQLVGRDEITVLAAAIAYQQHYPFHQRPPSALQLPRNETFL
jgi:aspartyl-tRNA(Asn)/glutamyl-tRNA(Gln) amidotransferase subunit A